ncbi:MAG: hypothetical protein GKS00_02075 [Alphaproteobacteria bacterium]|nr:hypothetical protein [Alphaproteobacteria bacterium]
MSKRFDLTRIGLERANRHVARWHRHHPPAVAHVFSIGCRLRVEDRPWPLVGAIVVGRPVARHLDDQLTLEVSRTAVALGPSARHACSALLGAAAREAWRTGMLRLITYTRTDESGASLRAAGWRRDRHGLDSRLEWDEDARLHRHVLIDRPFPARSWNTPGRPRRSAHRPDPRWRWQRFNPVLRHGRGWRDADGWTPAERLGIAACEAGARRDSNPFSLCEPGCWEEWREGYDHAWIVANPDRWFSDIA